MPKPDERAYYSFSSRGPSCSVMTTLYHNCCTRLYGSGVPGGDAIFVAGRAPRNAQNPQMAIAIDNCIGARAQPLERYNLLSSLPNDLSRAEGNRRGQLQLISSDCKDAFLIGPVPIRERTSVNMNGNGAVRLAY